jgi:hypothetical protein
VALGWDGSICHKVYLEISGVFLIAVIIGELLAFRRGDLAEVIKFPPEGTDKAAQGRGSPLKVLTSLVENTAT